jgi:hypothetical protein
MVERKRRQKNKIEGGNIIMDRWGKPDTEKQ